MPLSLPPRGYRIAVLMALVHMLAVGDRFLLSILIEPIKADLGLGDAAIGALQGPAFAFVNGAAVVPMILLARRWPLARLLALALIGSSVATSMSAFAGSVDLLIPARMLLGLAQAAVVPAAMGLIVAAMVPGHRGRGISLFTGGASLGRGLAMVGGGGLLALFTLMALPVAPWRLTSASAGLFGLPLALVVWRIAEPVALREDRRGRMGAALRHMIADRAMLGPHILSALCAVLVLQSLTSWSASLLIRMHALTPPQAGFQVGIAMMLAGAGGHALGGALADRRGDEGAPMLMLVGLALCTLALWPLTRTDSLGVAVAALVVAVVGLSIALANAMIGLQARIPPALRVEGTAIFLTLVTLLGTALGPWAVGLASQAIAGPTGLAEAIGRVLGATCLLGCGAAWVAGRRMPLPPL
ncbi:MFS transporter [Sphingomonas sanguinis]|uniref:MFS transporter n=1 Tax=Sphingomonas sanguinis TaxID=33051 RepID=A0ABU5LSS3_9SPHN|nr:MFS transporter [Sphingomonas sanguinis]MDZ7282987.1 MFS transporter [Sphingomonas sanguinis]